MTESSHIRHQPSPIESAASPVRRPIFNRTLWLLQALLALVFLFAGGAKLVLPAEAMQGPVSLPVVFLRFIGVCETLGALGLILPGLLKIRPGLTPLAAAGLAIIMTGATVVNLLGGASGVVPALITVVLGILAVVLCYGRWKITPLGGR